jgi:carbon-monoxide dehydrogenase large subunit
VHPDDPLRDAAGRPVRTPVIYAEVTASFTNTAPVDAYRGAGRPEATYVVERIVHQAALDLGIAQDEIRRRNFIRTFPVPDAGRARLRHRRLRRDARRSDADRRRSRSSRRARPRRPSAASFAASATRRTSRRAASRRRTSRGRSARRAGLFEAGEVRVHPTGSVTVFTGSHSHGQGHETTFAQVVRGGSASRSRTSTSSTATRAACRSAWARMARARSPSAARRS